MAIKWLVYLATYATYSIVHSIRTCWSSLKTVFNDEPYQFSQRFLGTLDMTVLFLIALLLNVFGGQVQRYSRRKLVFGMLVGLIINIGILFLFMVYNVTSQALYFIFYATTGILACLAWPICLYTTSQYFNSQTNATAISMWSSVSQTGDFIAFFITLIIIQSDSNNAYALLTLNILLIIVLIYDFFFFRDKGIANQFYEENNANNPIQQVQTPQHQINVNLEQNQDSKKQSSNSQLKQIREKVENIQGQEIAPKIQNVNVQQDQGKLHRAPTVPKPVNFLTVWLIPGVALPVLAFSTVKSINAIIISWLVLYFNKIGLVSQSRIIAIVWALSIVVGGFIISKVNKNLSYIIFIVCLFMSGFIFYLLEEFHVNPNQFQVIILISVCGILVGGPFNQLGTSVPLKLSEQPEIRNIPKAKSAIIALMQSFAVIICGFSILIVSGIGVMKLHYMAGALCFISVGLLAGEQIRKHLRKKNKQQSQSINSQQIKQFNKRKTQIDINPMPKNNQQIQINNLEKNSQKVLNQEKKPYYGRNIQNQLKQQEVQE